MNALNRPFCELKSQNFFYFASVNGGCIKGRCTAQSLTYLFPSFNPYKETIRSSTFFSEKKPTQVVKKRSFMDSQEVRDMMAAHLKVLEIEKNQQLRFQQAKQLEMLKQKEEALTIYQALIRDDNFRNPSDRRGHGEGGELTRRKK